MAYKVRCSHCGKSMMLPEGDAGLPVVCLACGTKFVAPDKDGPSVPPPPPAPTEPEPEIITRENAALYAPQPEPFRVPWLLVGVAAAILLIVVGIGWKAYQWNSVRSGTRELTQLLTEARSRAGSGDAKGAYDKYRDIERRSIELGIDHKAVRELTEAARLEQERVFVAAIAKPAPTASPVASPVTGPTSAPTVAENTDPDLTTSLDGSPTTQTASTGPTSAPAIAATTQPSSTAPSTQLAASRPTTGPTSRRVVSRAPIQPIPEPPNGVTDEQIGAAIQRGVNYMLRQFDDPSAILRPNVLQGSDARAAGLNALCVYALLQSGQAIPDQRLDVRGPYMKSLIGGMKRQQANEGVVTYARSIRATALSLYNRVEDRSALRADVQYLLATHSDGAYSYAGWRPSPGAAIRGPQTSWDNSNSQYGLLGVWSGAEAGMEVPSSYWSDVVKHWQKSQLPDGMWGYTSGGGTLSMTAAGTASLFVAEDYLYSARFATRVGRDPFSPQLKRALDWWEKADLETITPSAWWGYTLYGIERVGLASGLKYFGTTDWYRSLAGEIIERQQPDGAWGDTIDSAYALLFLARGRHPILMNKLRFEKGGTEGQTQGFWGNRPRDAANLARYAGRKLERPLNWQVATLQTDWQDWLDSPILSIASHKPPYFTAADREKFRQYVEAGGMLYLQADGETPEFDEFARTFSHDVFPQYEMTDVPPGHVIYNVLFKVDPPSPLRMVTNGSRVLILYSPKDLAKTWQLRDEKSKTGAFEIGTNIFIYAAGKRELRNRLSSPYVSPLTKPAPGGTINVARIKYGGAWDPEPGAWRRFANWFARQTGTGLAVKNTPLKDLDFAKARFAHLTGSAPYPPTPDEVKAMQTYVNAGGVLFIDACGASKPFSDGIKVALTQAFPDTRLQKLPRNHPLLEPGLPGMDDLAKPRVRLFTTEAGQAGNATFQFVKSGTGGVILTDLDVTTGLLGTETWGIAGFEPGYCQSLMKNLIFWTQDGKAGL